MIDVCKKPDQSGYGILIANVRMALGLGRYLDGAGFAKPDRRAIDQKKIKWVNFWMAILV